MADTDVTSGIPHSSNGDTGGGEPGLSNVEDLELDLHTQSDAGIERGEKDVVKAASPTVEKRKFPGEEAVISEVVGDVESLPHGLNGFGSAEISGAMDKEVNGAVSAPGEKVKSCAEGMEGDIVAEGAGAVNAPVELAKDKKEGGFEVEHSNAEGGESDVVAVGADTVNSPVEMTATGDLNAAGLEDDIVAVDAGAVNSAPIEMDMDGMQPNDAGVENDMKMDTGAVSAPVEGLHLDAKNAEGNIVVEENVNAEQEVVNESISMTEEAQVESAPIPDFAFDVSADNKGDDEVNSEFVAESELNDSGVQDPDIIPDTDVQESDVQSVAARVVSESVIAAVQKHETHAEPQDLLANMEPVKDQDDPHVALPDAKSETEEEQQIQPVAQEDTQVAPEVLVLESSNDKQEATVALEEKVEQEVEPIVETSPMLAMEPQNEVSEPIEAIKQHETHAEPQDLLANMEPVKDQDDPHVALPDEKSETEEEQQIQPVAQEDTQVAPEVLVLESSNDKQEATVALEEKVEQEVEPIVEMSPMLAMDPQKEVSEPIEAIKQEETHSEPPSADIHPLEDNQQIQNQTNDDLESAKPIESNEQKDKPAEKLSAIEQFGKKISGEILEMGMNAEKELQSAEVSSSNPVVAETPKEEVSSTKAENVAEEKEREETESQQQTEMDVLGNGLLIKKILSQGEGPSTRPVNGDIVTATIKGKLDDGTAVDCHEAHKFTLGDGDVIQALDLGVALMEKGEQCELTTASKYAYGILGDASVEPHIPPNARLTYDLHLLNVEEPVDISKLNASQKTQLGDKKRERGNYYYGREEYTSAINLYTKALQILDDSRQSQSDDPSDLQQLLDTRVKCYNNLALAQYKVEAYGAALKSCDKVLVAQPDNVKALFRKGKCLADTGETEDAIIVLRKALALEPQRRNVHQELSRLLSKKKAEDEKQKEMYKRMIGADKEPSPSPEEKKTNWSYVLLGGLMALAAVVIGMTIHRQH